MWRPERNICRKMMKKEIKKEKNKQLDKIIENIQSAPNDAKMFRAVQELKRKPYENPVVKENGKYIKGNQARYNIINTHFKNKFSKPDITPIERFIEEPKPLNQPITTDEVKKAVSKMTNNRAADRMGINAELVKYAPISILAQIAILLNNIFSNHVDIDTGDGELVPLPKPLQKRKDLLRIFGPSHFYPLLGKFCQKSH